MRDKPSKTSDPAVGSTRLLGVLSTREETVVKLREQGITFREIGLRIGCTTGNANALHMHARRQLNRAREWTAGLSVRAANVLNNRNINSHEEALAFFKSHGWKEVRRWRNYGWKTHKIVFKWLRLPAPRKPKPNK